MANRIVDEIVQGVVARLKHDLVPENVFIAGNPNNRTGNKVIPRSFTVKEVAVYIGRSEIAVYRLVAKRQIPCVRHGRTVRFLKDDIDKWLEGDRV